MQSLGGSSHSPVRYSRIGKRLHFLMGEREMVDVCTDYNTLEINSEISIMLWHCIMGRKKSPSPCKHLTNSESRSKFSTSCSLYLPPSVFLLYMSLNLCLPEGSVCPCVSVCVCLPLTMDLLNIIESITWDRKGVLYRNL